MTVAFDTQPDRELVRFTIDKGARWSIRRVDVTGAVSMPPHEVQSALETRPRGVLEVGRYVSDEASRDRDALASLYRAGRLARRARRAARRPRTARASTRST